MGVYVFLAFVGLMILQPLMMPAGALIAAALGTFAAAAISNAVALRIYERAQLADIGMGWNRASRRNLLIGIGGGIGAAAAVTAIPVVLRLADYVAAPAAFNFGSVIFVAAVLLFGAVGEEMLFRGYVFQLLMKHLGEWATILPFAGLFAFPHLMNPNQSALGLLNTFLWGVVLGWAFVRSGDLWLPIGLHAGWNISLSLLGANLSGFTMGVTGIAMRWRVPDIVSGGGYGPEGGILTTLVLIPLVYFLRRVPIERQKPFLCPDVGE